MQRFDGKVDVGAGGRQRVIQPRCILNLSHNLFSLVDLSSDLSRLTLQNLQSVNHVIIVQDPAFSLVEAGEQVLLEMAQAQLELSLQLQQIAPLLINIRTLRLEHLVQTLRLQAGPCHGKVDERHP